jgi:multimeric flavodoxin WrbA
MSRQLLIVYHSQSGASFQLAAAARRGAALEDDVAVRWLRAWDACTGDLRHCDGLLLVAPENSATVAGAMKDFLDRTFYPAQPLQLGLPYGLIISAGNDGRGAAAQVQRILSGFPMKPVAEPLICRGEVSQVMLRECRDLGQTLAAGLSMGIF